MVAAVLAVDESAGGRPELQQFAEWLRRTRARRGISRRQVGRYADVSHNTVALWERAVHLPERDSLEKLARGLGEPYSLLRDLVEGKLTAEDALAGQQVSELIARDVEEAVERVFRRWGLRPPDDLR